MQVISRCDIITYHVEDFDDNISVYMICEA